MRPRPEAAEKDEIICKAAVEIFQGSALSAPVKGNAGIVGTAGVTNGRPHCQGSNATSNFIKKGGIQ